MALKVELKPNEKIIIGWLLQFSAHCTCFWVTSVNYLPWGKGRREHSTALGMRRLPLKLSIVMLAAVSRPRYCAEAVAAHFILGKAHAPQCC